MPHTPRLARAPRGVVIASVIAITVIVVTASPAAADPANPTNYESRVIELTPPTPGIETSIIGGDSFVRLRLRGAADVVVLGYEGEPYLRFTADGTVRENSRSPAVVLNQSRYGTTYDERADAKAQPEWQVVADDGTYVWHDHRIHWMAKSTPPTIEGGSTGKVLDWTIPLVVDGASVQINGELHRSAAPSLVLPIAGGVLATVAGGLLMRRSRRAPAVVLLVVALAATVVSAIDQLSIPAAAGRRMSYIVIPALAAACAIVALGRSRSIYAFALKAAAALILPMWIVLNAKALTRAHLPSDLSPAAIRLSLVASVAAVVAFFVIDAPRELQEAARRNAELARQRDD
jgi:hypothetical protein